MSGTLAYSFGMGKPVVSTPYRHAAELLADGRGMLVPFANPAAIADAVLGLLEDPARMQAMREEAYRLGRGFVWARIGERYLDVFREARRDTPALRASMRGARMARPGMPVVAAGASGLARGAAWRVAAVGAGPSEPPARTPPASPSMRRTPWSTARMAIAWTTMRAA